MEEYIKIAYNWYAQYAFYRGIYIIAIEILLIFSLIFLGILRYRRKITDTSNEKKTWSSEDRLFGLNMALHHPSPLVSKLTVSLTFISIIGIAFSIYGIYDSLEKGKYASIMYEIVSYILWLIVGALALFYIALKNKFFKILHSYHVDYLKKTTLTLIDEIRNLFVIIAWSILREETEPLLPPYIYRYNIGNKKNWISPYFHDEIRFTGIFPGATTSIFFVDEPSILRFSLYDTVKQVYASKYGEKTKTNSEMSNFIDKILPSDIKGHLEAISYKVLGFDNTQQVLTLRDVNPDFKPYIVIFNERDIFNFRSIEMFYKDINKVVNDNDIMTLIFNNNERRHILKQNNADFDRDVDRTIRELIRQHAKHA